MTRRLLLAGAIAALTLSCKLSDSEFERLFRWMNCEECRGPERVEAASVGPKAVPTLARWLRDGPPADRQQVMRQKITSAYRAAGGVAASAEEAAYVASSFNNYVDRYYQRSALLLSDIATPDAVDALDDAIANAATRGYRPHVLGTIRFARGRIGTTPFLGSVSPRIVGFGDSVHVSLLPLTPLSGLETAMLDGQPFAVGDLVLRRESNVMTFPAVALPGRHWVQLRGFPGTVGVQTTELTINTLADATDRATRRCADIDYVCVVLWAPPISLPVTGPGPIPAANFPHTAFLSLSRAVRLRDTLDYFKIHPAIARTVTARLEWHDGADLDLQWRECAPPMPQIPPTDGATSNSPEQTSTTIPAAQCRLLVVFMKTPVGDSTTLARLTVTSP
jgi:hypothetical protein